jgi:hypothetical protein
MLPDIAALLKILYKKDPFLTEQPLSHGWFVQNKPFIDQPISCKAIHFARQLI